MYPSRTAVWPELPWRVRLRSPNTPSQPTPVLASTAALHHERAQARFDRRAFDCAGFCQRAQSVPVPGVSCCVCVCVGLVLSYQRRCWRAHACFTLRWQHDLAVGQCMVSSVCQSRRLTAQLCVYCWSAHRTQPQCLAVGRLWPGPARTTTDWDETRPQSACRRRYRAPATLCTRQDERIARLCSALCTIRALELALRIPYQPQQMLCDLCLVLVGSRQGVPVSACRGLERPTLCFRTPVGFKARWCCC